MRAVLWDMDGTLVDSEKLWDISMYALYERMGGTLTPHVRAATVGGSTLDTMRIVYQDLGLELDPADMADTAEWLHDHATQLFVAGLPWRPGAQQLLDALTEAGIPMALVTNTRRELTEVALQTIGAQYFSAVVCGDEVAHGKPAPDPYLAAAAHLNQPPQRCLAIEDSLVGATAAHAAGCRVLVVPDADRPPVLPPDPRRRQVNSLCELDVARLRTLFAEMVECELHHALGREDA